MAKSPENMFKEFERIGKEVFGEKIDQQDQTINKSINKVIVSDILDVIRRNSNYIEKLINKKAKDLLDKFYILYYDYNVQIKHNFGIKEKILAAIKDMEEKGLQIEDLLIDKKDISSFFNQNILINVPEVESIVNEIKELFYLSNSLNDPSLETVLSILRILRHERGNLKKELERSSGDDKKTETIKKELQENNKVLMELIEEDVEENAEKEAKKKIGFDEANKYKEYVELERITVKNNEYKFEDLYKIKVRGEKAKIYFKEEWDSLSPQEKKEFEDLLNEIKIACQNSNFSPPKLTALDLYIDKRLAEIYQKFKEALGDKFIYEEKFIDGIKNIKNIIKKKSKKQEIISEEEKDFVLNFITSSNVVPQDIKKGLAFRDNKGSKIGAVLSSGVLGGAASAGVAYAIGAASISMIPFLGGGALAAWGAIKLIKRKHGKIIVKTKSDSKKTYSQKDFKELISRFKDYKKLLKENVDKNIFDHYNEILEEYKEEYINDKIDQIDLKQLIKELRKNIVNNAIQQILNSKNDVRINLEKELERTFNVADFKQFINDIYKIKLEVVRELTGDKNKDIEKVAGKIYGVFNSIKGNVQIKSLDEFKKSFLQDGELINNIDKFLNTKQNSDWIKLVLTALQYIT